MKTGEIQPVKIYLDRPYFKRMPIHRIMAYTFLGGYKPGYDVHHIDENPLNNALSNLVYLTHSEHARLHAAHKGKNVGPKSEETRLKMSEARKGKKLSTETRLKMSLAKKGKPLSAEHRAKLSTAMKGKNIRPKSEETRLKISESLKGKTSCWKGKNLSAEHRTKIAEAMRRNRVETTLTNLN